MALLEESREDTVETLYKDCALGQLIRHVVPAEEMDEYQQLYRHDFLCMMYKCQTEHQQQEYQVLFFYPCKTILYPCSYSEQEWSAMVEYSKECNSVLM